MNERRTSAVLWFTGLSGAGKTTLASAVDRELRSRRIRSEYLDGDALRVLSPTGFSRAERDAHVKRTGFVASCLERHGVTVICALISPYAEAREAVRAMCGRFIEIYVSTPLDVCESRDVKGLYARARRGEVAHFTGIDDPYEPPQSPELVIDTSRTPVEQAVAAILDRFEETRLPAPAESWQGTSMPAMASLDTPLATEGGSAATS